MTSVRPMFYQEYCVMKMTHQINSVKHTYSFVCCCCLAAQSCPTLWLHGLQPARLLCPWDFPGKSTGVGCHFLLQGIFPIQGSNLHFLHYKLILYHRATWEARSPSIQQCIYEVAIMWIPLGGTPEPQEWKGRTFGEELVAGWITSPLNLCV